MTIEQEIAQYALDTGTYSFGLFDAQKIDEIDFYIEDIKQKFGIFESEIDKLVELLEELKIINNVSYEQVSRINPDSKIEGNAYTAEVSIPRIKDFIKNGVKNGIYTTDELPVNIAPEQKTDSESNITSKPFTRVENGVGYFKFYKEGSNIKVGKENTRQFKLLRCLTEPNFGIQKAIEAVFEAIKQPKDDDDSRLSGLDSPQRKTRMLEIIEYTKKELQKNKDLQGKINYCMNKKKQNMWLK